MVILQFRNVWILVLVLIISLSFSVLASSLPEPELEISQDIIPSDLSTIVVSDQSGSSISEISSTVIIRPSNQGLSNQNPSAISDTPKERPPGQWLKGNTPGQFFDPISRTSWQYDPILKKFYCQAKGWYLISKFSEDKSEIFGQYYYDPLSVSFIDIATGKLIDPNSMEVQVLPTPSPVLTKTPTPTPIVSPDITQEQCLVSCPDCLNGYCHDCNLNQICDEYELDNTGSATSGQSENPQDLIQPAPGLSPTITPGPTQSSGQSESPQVPIQPKPTVLPTVTETSEPTQEGISENPQVIPQPTQPPQPPSEGGLSESAQTPILAMLSYNQWTNENEEPVLNNPESPTEVTFEVDVGIISIGTYHWNEGAGVVTVGTIGLKDTNGKTYGPWQATGEDKDGAKNAYWMVSPITGPDNDNLQLPKGVYTVIDSDPQTWSHNEKSKNQGFATVRFMKTNSSTTLNQLPEIKLEGLSI